MQVQFVAPVGDERFKFDTSNNEAGIKAMEAQQPLGETVASTQLLVAVEMSSNEWRLMYFAVKAQRDAYVKQLEVTDHDDWEEQMFLHGEVAKLAKFLHQMELDFDKGGQRLAKAFLNV